jgi:hypothetical protein
MKLKTSQYTVKMLKDTAVQKLFMSYAFNQTHGGVNGEDYKTVYHGEIEPGRTTLETLERIWFTLNMHHPADYNHRSLSVSDVVALPGDDGIWYADSSGWVRIF